LEEEKLSEAMTTAIKLMRYTHKSVFCTNGYSLSYDTQGNEVYGIFDLVALFQELSEYALVISDPSGTYAAYFREAGLVLPVNVSILEGPHPFIPVLKTCDVFIRATSTDGDSISVKEALFFGKLVIATNVVSRPQECLLYEPKDQDALAERIRESHLRLGAHQVKMTINAEGLSCWQSLKMIYHALQGQ